MKQPSRDTRERAIAAFKNGIKIKDICETFGICRKTLYNWRLLDAAGCEQIPKPKGHKPRILSDLDDELIKTYIEENPSITAREIKEKLGISCCSKVIYRAIKRIGMTFKKKK